jgi:hypothetical protein
LREFVIRLIQKKKEDRPANFAAVSAELKQLIRLLTGKDEATVALNQPRKKVPFFDRPFRQQAGWLVGLCCLILAASAGLGWTTRTKDLDTVESTGHSTVQAMPNAKAALYYAETNPQDEAAWVALKEFPNASEEYKGRAKTALGLIYLKSGRKELADSTFRSLMEVTSTRANGLVGQALVAHSKGDLAGDKQLISQVDESNTTLSPRSLTHIKTCVSA